MPLTPPTLLLNERTSIAFSYGLVAAMLACAAVPFLEFGQRFAPTWNGNYLLPAIFLIALEGLLSWRAASKITFPSFEWTLYRLTEIVVLFGGLKLYTYTQRGFDQLLADLPLWQQNFSNFFNGEYLFALILSLLAWALATYFASALSALEGDDFLFKVERDSKVESDRGGARKHLVADIFVVGGVMLVLTAVLRNNLAFLGFTTRPLQTGLFNVVLYFIFGLILLAQSQFAVLRARWSLDQVPIAHNLAPRWAVYSLLLLSVCAVLVVFLPTRYALGLLDTLAFLINLLKFLVFLIIFILWLPIQFILGLFGRQTSSDSPISATPLEPLGPADPNGGAIPWLEIIKSILFWSVLLGLVGFSLYYYLRQRADLLTALAKLPALAWLARFWNWFTGGLRQMDTRARAALKSVAQRLRPTRVAAASAWSFVNLRRLSARQQIYFYYLALLRRADVPRRPSQTPFEYQQQLSHLPPDDLSGLTQSFIEARYTPHEITRDQVSLARRFWENIRRALRRSHTGIKP